ncbi:hypothetical protein PGT21_027195 [Puccinia graminis f. sp. tritici]|uniref:Uncharacterized protein n=1 Tax=Puccinia graminis f. sp. tritici TaxID=56615 RepID=A0A5B0QX71_PUCGR|nr:hypothetical protein PGT21_024775 [Puccinia graminis f. sp. tritici]KAA1117911.1 hypothetical protein PGT21_027195 [Puccinia graminis f. sp. tritici]
MILNPPLQHLSTPPPQQSLVVYQSLATWPTAPCYLLPATIWTEIDPSSSGDALSS